jgi:hypothetical protein
MREELTITISLMPEAMVELKKSARHDRRKERVEPVQKQASLFAPPSAVHAAFRHRHHTHARGIIIARK